jgi:DNA-binding beta-propeller fold protein YncE
MQSGMYAANEDTQPELVWGRDRFMPTNIAFHPSNGDFYVADGYGAYAIHVYDRDAKYKSTIGKPGMENGQFNTPHGVWIDRRSGREPSIVVTDRANNRLQWFSFDGSHLETLDGFLLPANVDTFNDVMLIPELQARLTLLDGKNKVIARIGDDATWRETVMKMEARKNPDRFYRSCCDSICRT